MVAVYSVEGGATGSIAGAGGIGAGAYSTMSGAGAVGIGQACLDACVDFARRRRQFGKRIGDFEMIQGVLADMAAEVEAARWAKANCAITRSLVLDTGPSSMCVRERH